MQVKTLPDSIDILNWEYQQDTGSLFLPLIDSTLSKGQKALSIYYQRFSTSLERVYQPNQIKEYIQEAENTDSLRQSTFVEDTRYTSEIEQSGSLSRGIIVGSNQDFALESGLQFQLSGKLTEKISLDAVLTDQSIPFQPDGTTQSIREFDRVLIRLQSEQAQLEMGDVDVRLSNSIFARLNRRLQGASGEYSGEQNNSKFAVSSVRGTFSSQQFLGIEGVRGPYRLTGRNNEPFVIILAGTERVFLNGQLVQRGEENEYIIDYGLGEIYFTDQVFIKDETRIFVEYEYVDQEFSRTLISGEANQKLWNNKLELGVSVIRMADGNDLLSQQSLSADDIDILESVGDQTENAIVSGIVSNPEDDEFNIRYALIDTVFQGQNYQIFKNIPGSTTSNIAVRFSNVGQGNGSYVRVGNVLNGLLYEWRGPGSGSYEPFRNLPAPEKHQMVSITGSHQITERLSWYGEVALSDVDQNRFSTLDDNDNADVAFIGGLSAEELEIGTVSLDVNYQRRQSGENFEAFERTREIEFDRRWNISETDINGEKMDEFRVAVKFGEKSKADAEIGRLMLPGQQSLRQSAGVVSEMVSSTYINYKQEYARTSFEITGMEDSWLKQISNIRTDISKTISGTIDVEHEDKQNRRKEGELANSSFRFIEVIPGIEVRVNSAVINAGIGFREENIAQNGSFINAYDAIEQLYGLEWEYGTLLSTDNTIRLRNKKTSETLKDQGVGNSNALLISSENQLETESLSLRSRYSVNTQRQSIVQESYFEVGPELGQYVWLDGNENGIEEIDEFFPELSPNEGTYILQYLPSDELVPSTELRFRNGFEWQPFFDRENESDQYQFLQSIRLESRFDVLENSTNPKESDIYLLRFKTFRNDSLSIQGRLHWSNRIEFQPTNRWESSLFMSNTKSLNRRSSETVRSFDQQIVAENQYSLSNNQSVSLTLSSAIKENDSDFLLQRNFNIKEWEVEPGYRFRYSRSLQFGVKAGYSSRVNRINSVTSVNSKLYRAVFTTRAFLLDRVQFGSNTEFRNATLTGETNTFTNFELTEGTGVGNHFIWSINASYRVSNLVRVTFNYDGRTVARRPDIHTLKLVVSAIF